MKSPSFKAEHGRPIQGVGVGLRSNHFDYILQHQPDIPWFEVLADNYFVDGGATLAILDQISARYPCVFHSVGMSIGSTDPLNVNYFKQYRALCERIKPAWVSDHLCWVSVGRRYLHELMPLPYRKAVISHVSDRIKKIQDLLGYPLLIENVSSYLSYQESEMPEWEFINAMAEKAGCGILLDINNIYVSAFNHAFDPNEYLSGIDVELVKQFHLAGYQDMKTHLLDTHGAPVFPSVWALYEKALEKFNRVPTLIEWDTDIPEFPVLKAEAEKAKLRMDRICR